MAKKENILAYLETLAPTMLERLCTQPATCLAIFRSLPNLAKLFIMRVLYLPNPVPMATVSMWCKPEHQREFQQAMEKMRRLHLLDDSEGYFTIMPEFARQLTNAFSGGGDKGSFGVPSTSDDKRGNVDIHFLDSYSRQRWELILHYMLDISANQRPSEGVISLLSRSGLVSPGSSTNNITNKGFQFLLQNINEQVWTLLLQYVDMTEDELNMDRIQVLSFLFQLGSMTLGMGYKVSKLTQTQRTMLEDLKDFGLAYQRDATSHRFYPTHLATSLTSASAVNAETGMDGFIIVETNYKIYAYTDSPLQIAILNLFANLKYRFANLVVGSVQRESVFDAFVKGITADQILNYLETHAHPQAKKRATTIPPTVADQIRLWHLERDRLKQTPGVLYNEFDTQQDYLAVVQYARDLGVLLYENGTMGNGLLIVSTTGQEQVKAFVKRHISERK